MDMHANHGMDEGGEVTGDAGDITRPHLMPVDPSNIIGSGMPNTGVIDGDLSPHTARGSWSRS